MNTFSASKQTHERLLSVLEGLNIQLSKAGEALPRSPPTTPGPTHSYRPAAPGVGGGHAQATRGQCGNTDAHPPARNGPALSLSLWRASSRGPRDTASSLFHKGEGGWAIRQIQEQNPVLPSWLCQFRQFPSGL